jgi:hypothetical protein
MPQLRNRKKAPTEGQLESVARVITELMGSGQLVEQDEPIAIAAKPDPSLLDAGEFETLRGYTKRLSRWPMPPPRGGPTPPPVPTGQRAAALAQAERIERTFEQSGDAVREKGGAAAAALAQTIRSRGVPLHGRDLQIAREALAMGNPAPEFVMATVDMNERPARRGLRRVSDVFNDEEIVMLKELIAKACNAPTLFADHASERILRRAMARIKAEPEPKRRVFEEPGSVVLPVSVLEDVLRVGEVIEDGYELIGCELADLATLAVLLFAFDRLEAFRRGWSFTVEDGEPVLRPGSSRGNPLPPRADPDGQVGSGFAYSLGRLIELGWFAGSAKAIRRGPRLVELDQARGVTYSEPAAAVAS